MAHDAGDSRIPERTEVLILGGGPIGIEAALAARAAGYETALLEAGQVGDAVRRWGHVRLFSPWSYNRSPRGIDALEREGLPVPGPDDRLPTGREIVDEYLVPLARSAELRDVVHTGVRALGASRAATLKGDHIGDPRRANAPFRVLWERGDEEGVTTCDILIDATGVYDCPNASGSGGIPAPGERRASASIVRYLPDISGVDRARYQGARVLVLGDGYSAATAARELARLRAARGTGEVTWAFRSRSRAPLAEIAGDPLAERAQLTRDANALATQPPPGFRVLRGAAIQAFETTNSGVRAILSARREADEPRDETVAIDADVVLSLTGYHPDSSLLSELQVHHCYATDGLMKLSAHLLGSAAAGGDCLEQSAGGAATLVSPEPGLFVLGSKSFGRFSHFLLRTGVEQVETIFGEILSEGAGTARHREDTA